ncbi:MAG: glycosyltransferase family 4 protein [Patescibacteria group bacterium]
MKIALIGQKGIPTKQGGIEKHVQELSTRLAKAGLDVTVYSRPHYTGNHNEKFEGVKIVNLPSINTKNLDAISHTLIASIHALFQDYDIIHYHGVGPSLLAWIPRIFKPNTKVIATFHCIDKRHQKWGLIARTFLGIGEWTACHFPHETIVVSQTLKKYCKYRFDHNSIYIPNGVQIEKAKAESNILKEYGLDKDEYVLLVSRLVKHKGIHTLIKAYNKVKTKKKLVIVGASANTDDYASYIQKLAKNNKNVVFTGQKEKGDLKTLFDNAYLFVQPSEAEGLSIALLEGLAYGIPTIASDIEENLEVIQNFGLKFRNKSVKDLSKQLDFALKNPGKIKTLAKKAKQHVDKEYDWKKIVKQTIGVYEDILIPELKLKKAYQA